jgi:putative transcriptional regulator
MTIRHHAHEETLLRCAAGTLPAGLALVVATHTAGCPTCRARLADFEAIGGVLLREATPTLMAPDALATILASVDAGTPETAKSEGARLLKPAALARDGIVLPEPLRHCEIGRWRWIAPGAHISKVGTAGDAQVLLMKIGANRNLPRHGHAGRELTQVISGSFSDHMGHYGPGDLIELGDEVDHQPVVDPGGDCICLVAIAQKMRFHGLLARLMQPFIRL